MKIWIPSNEKPPKMGDLAATVRRNLKRRKEDLDDQAIDGHMMWALLNHMRRTERQRRVSNVRSVVFLFFIFSKFLFIFEFFLL